MENGIKIMERNGIYSRGIPAFAGMTAPLRGIPAFAGGWQETIRETVNWIASGFAFAMTARPSGFAFAMTARPSGFAFAGMTALSENNIFIFIVKVLTDF
jgi:hypothetical protein